MDQSTINVSQNINSNLENTVSTEITIIYAGFWRRFAAAFLDGLITGLIGFILGFFAGKDMVLNISLSAIVGLIYFSIFDSSEMLGSPGKAMMGLSILGENSKNRISFKTALIRHIVRWASGALMMIGFIMQIFTSKRQTLHDMASETIVIKKNPPEINYFKAFKENFNKVIG